MASYPQWTFLLRPWSRLELPAWGRALALARVSGWRHDASLWADAPTVVTRGKVHGFLMRLELSSWAERVSYFLGRYYELHMQLLLPELLEPGDRMLDVGANIGMVTLCASALVGKDGLVESFEPNPECVARLEDQLALNGIRNVRIHPIGLSDAACVMKLRLQSSRRDTSRHSGIGTLARVTDSSEDVVFREFDVDVRCGDTIALAQERRIALVKIDVEGFELHALRGLRGVLERWHPPVVTEYLESHLVRGGTSRAELRAWMEALGYRPYAFFTERHLLRHRLVLLSLRDNSEEGLQFDDVLWLHAGDPMPARLRRFIR